MQGTIKGLVLKNFPLRYLSLVATRGTARYFFEPESIDDMVKVINYLKKGCINYIIVGCSSNTLWGDGYFDGAVISTRKLRSISLKGRRIEVTVGVRLTELVRLSCDNGYSGVEELSGIPGTIGGAVVMNAGAFGRTISDVISEVVIFNGRTVDFLKRDEIKFGYRNSSLKGSIVLGAVIELVESDRERVTRRVSEILLDRKRKFPKGPSLGSVFRNPENNFAAKLIEEAGLKGFRIGSAWVSEKHANFFLSDRNGCATDYVKLVNFVKDRVYELFGIRLEEEIVYAGSFS